MPGLGITDEVSMPMPMHTRRARTILALAGALLLVALVATGCGRRPSQPATGAAQAPSPAIGVASSPAPAGTVPAAIAPAADPTGSPPVTAATPAAVAPAARTPVPTPDLVSIQDLLTQIDHDLNADASAGTSEGSPQ
jgi:hypothetical protein